MNALLLNRDFAMPDDGWFHLVPMGEFPHTSGVVQVIDAKATGAMLNRFTSDKASPNFPGLLVDFDHFSDSTEHASEAAGWVDDLDNRGDGIWGHIRWSDSGEAAVKGGRYRLVSPVFNARDAEPITNAAKKLRPLRLVKVAITNDPNLKGMVPLSNRDGASAPAANPTNKMKTIATKLGLSAEASEDAILAAVTQILNRADGAEAKVAFLTKENGILTNRVTEQDSEHIETELTARGIEGDRRTRLTPILAAMKNRNERVEFLDEVFGEIEDEGGVTTTPSGKPVLNRGAARTPAPKRGGKGEDAQSLASKAEAAVQEIKLANRCTYTEATNIAMRTKPELFGLHN